jgi:hypothetical protein
MHPRLLLFGTALLSLAAFSRADEVSPADAELFTTKVQPLLQEACYKCHSHSSDKIKGGLVMDSREALITGGDTGPAMEPGHPEKSLIIEAISYANADLQMPPKGKKLADEQIALLTEWVKRGAPWPQAPGSKMTSRPKGKITDEDRQWWAFQPVAKPTIPPAPENAWARNEIDRFIYKKLQTEGLKPAPRAEKAQLIRRVYFDVVGLPPTPEEVEAFVRDTAPDAWEKLVDRLLASPSYGEHWARHWLDLVRYAESDGYRADDYRPDAWRYRDYVIRALNGDKPYNRFVAEQLAGDEVFPGDVDARIATGYLRHWIYEYNNRDAAGQWTNILNDITDVTSDVFLGLGMQCARCHDHKFDPILQKDYFRLQAFFAPILPRDDLKLATPQQEAEYKEKLAGWEEKTTALRQQIAAIEEPHKRKAAEDAITKFPPETQAVIRKPVSERKPYEHQIAELAYRQVYYEYDRLLNKMRGGDKDKLVALYKELSAHDAEKPAPLAKAFCATDNGLGAPPVTIPKKASLGEIEPGFLTLLDEKPAAVSPPFAGTTGRRKALVEWITNPTNPLTARVMVNRVWQYHFGRGLVGTASDFGKLGEKPSHPELLDYLANTFVEQGWSLKKLHRAILLSAAYQQSVHHPDAKTAQLKDPENRFLWRGSTRRLDAEQIRDAVLATTGELKPGSEGSGVDWTQPRRTIYTKVIRNQRDPLLEVFDAPEGFQSTPQRLTTTTPTQSLLMINSQWSLQRARAFAKRVQKEAASSDPSAVVIGAYQLAYARQPAKTELEKALAFLDHQRASAQGSEAPAAAPPPFAADRMRLRDGRAAVLAPGSTQERLEIPASPFFPKSNFTAEAYVVLKSLYESGEVRTIVSQWDNKGGHPGWSLGVTSKGSRYKPQTLVLQLSGDHAASVRDPIDRIFSGLQIEFGKPYYVGVSVDLDDPSEKGITFYAKDLSNDDEPMQVSQVKHVVMSGIGSDNPIVIGGVGGGNRQLFDGLIDDVRVSDIPLSQDQLLPTSAIVTEHTCGFWRFEQDPGVYKDSSLHSNDIVARAVEAPKTDALQTALTDFCQVILNSNEFLYLD